LKTVCPAAHKLVYALFLAWASWHTVSLTFDLLTSKYHDYVHLLLELATSLYKMWSACDLLFWSY